MYINLNRDFLSLKAVNGRNFCLYKPVLEPLKSELEDFLHDKEHLMNLDFAKKVMFSHEIKSNNTIEGINDSVQVIKEVIDNDKSVSKNDLDNLIRLEFSSNPDLLKLLDDSEEALDFYNKVRNKNNNFSEIIEKVMEKAKLIPNIDKRNRILNLYKAYQYILQGKPITEENIASLYRIISKDLISPKELSMMGDKYRNAPVYILFKGRLMDETTRTGLDNELIPEFINNYLNFVNNKYYQLDSETDYFIKSQIMHFYFVYIHPYFDTNGRTSRTIAMWYLLNNQIYPYIIFNRGINFDSKYDERIRRSETTYDLTDFLKSMLINTKKELEKEYVIQALSLNSLRKWEAIDYQMIEYFLSLKGERNIINLSTIYNNNNEHTKPQQIYQELIIPLLEDGTFIIERETKKYMFNEEPNKVLKLNNDHLRDVDMEQLKHIKI